MLTNFVFSGELKLLFQVLNKDDDLRIVGGCVRDFLHNEFSDEKSRKVIFDIDLACKYKPEETIQILESHNIRIIPTGLKHGTITAIINGKSFEITTLRKDVEVYGRKAKVEFVDSFLEDAKRRDFTINAMSIDANGNLFDYFNGFDDLKNQKVKFIGDVASRITEDYLRILRFFRFSCYYSGEIDGVALKEIIKLKSNLKTLSSHRIRSELIKIIECQNKSQLLKILEVMISNQILQEILPIFKIDLTILENLLEIAKINPEINNSDFLVKFCALIYSNKEYGSNITKILEFSNKDKKYIDDLLDLSSKVSFDNKKSDLIKILFNFEKNLLIDALKINFSANSKFNQANFSKLLDVIYFINEINLPNFIINGNDLINLEIDNKSIGQTLIKLRDVWIESDFKISKKELLQEFIKKHYTKSNL